MNEMAWHWRQPFHELGHVDHVTSLAFSGDGAMLASGSWDGTAKVWDVRSGDLSATLFGPRLDAGRAPACGSVSFLKDDRTVACAFRQNTALWSFREGSVLYLPLGRYRKILVSPQGRAVTLEDESALVLWEIDGWRRLRSRHVSDHPLLQAAIAADGRAVAFMDGKTIMVLDGDLAIVWWRPCRFNHGLASLSFSADGRLLACAISDDPPVVYNAANGDVVAVLRGARDREDETESRRYHHLVALSPGGDTAATTSRNGILRSSDLKDPTITRVFPATADMDLFSEPEMGAEPARIGKGYRISSIAFSPDGSILASAGSRHAIHLWDAHRGTLVRRLGDERNAVLCLALPGSGDLLASGHDDGTVNLWDWRRGTLRHSRRVHRDRVLSIAATPRHATIVTGCWNGELGAWGTPCLDEKWTLEGSGRPVVSSAISPDGTRAAVLHMEPQGRWVCAVRLLGVETRESGPVITQRGRPTTILRNRWKAAVAYSPNGRILAASKGRGVGLWNAVTGAAMGSLPLGGYANYDHITSLAFSPDGRRLAGGMISGVIQLWDLEERSLVTKLKTRSEAVDAVAYSPDGRIIAAASTYDNMGWLFDTFMGGLIVARLDGHRNSVKMIRFSADGKVVFTGSHDGLIRVWEVGSGRLVRSIVTQRPGV